MAFRGWIWTVDASTLQSLVEATLAEPPRIRFANQAALLPGHGRWSDQLAATQNGSVSLPPLPPVEMVLDLPGFAPDYFQWGGFSFASAALRAQLALPADVVEYLPVDTRSCRPEAAARDYQVMNPVRVRPIIDLARTAHERAPMQRWDGTIGDGVILPPEQPQYWQSGFMADAPLFRAAHSHAIIVDDALARRLLSEGLTGLAFQDIASTRGQAETVLMGALDDGEGA